MSKKRRNPFQGFMDQMSEMNRVRQVGMGRTADETGHENRRRDYAAAWVPSTDIFSEGQDLVIRVSLSGMYPEDVEITFSDCVLTVSGERKSGLDEEETSFYVRERYYGAFRRSMTLPTGVDGSKVSADFENGLLEITVRGLPPQSPNASRSGTDPAKRGRSRP